MRTPKSWTVLEYTNRILTLPISHLCILSRWGSPTDSDGEAFFMGSVAISKPLDLVNAPQGVDSCRVFMLEWITVMGT